jgi:ABC-2 type transport system ATP-binding protein
MTLRIENLKKTYKNGVEALKGITLNVQEGDFLAFLGPNGAGKSTMLGILGSSVIKTSGHVSVMGYNLDTHPFEAKKVLGIMPQEFNLNIFETPLQILHTNACYYGLSRIRAVQRSELLLKKLDLWSCRHRMTRMLSGGMKRRLMVARALMHEPKILILDEPTAGIDVELRKVMWDFLKEENAKGLTVILTTHYLEEVEHLCQTMAIINKGRMVRMDTLGNLLHTLEKERLTFNLKEPIAVLPSSEWHLSLSHSKQLVVEKQPGQSLNDLFTLFNHHGIQVASFGGGISRLEQFFLTVMDE